MNINSIGITDLFNLLESNKLGEVEEIKKVFHEFFLCTKDNWLVNGLFDYYLSTNSLRAVEVLAGVRDPHDKHLLDRLSEALSKSGSNSQRIQTLTLLGHIARRQPTWLYKLTSHTLFRDLLKLLKMEADTLSLMSSLLLLVMLLPMLPAALGPYLPEIFEVFGRLASYYHHQSSSVFSSPMHFTSTSVTGVIDKNHLYLLHLQVGLYSLFHRLYALYPCNFISYLKQLYIQRDQLATFTHTIRPMLDSVRMHPLLVTASKDTEISATRWKKMEHHDVMAECGRFTLDKCREEIFNNTNSRSTPPLDYSSVCIPISASGGIAPSEAINGEDETFWSPSMTVPPQSPQFPATTHEQRSAPSTPNNRSGTSPPEAAVEATPETTPVKDLRKLSTRQIPMGSAAVRALTAFGNGTVGPSSRPSTPVPVNPPVSGSVVGGGDGNNAHGFLSHKISKIMSDRQIVTQPKSSVNVDEDGRFSETDTNQNGKNDSWQEDQEVLEIVSSQAAGKFESSKHIERPEQHNEKLQNAFTDLSQRVYQLRLYSQSQTSEHFSNSNSFHKIRKSESCPDIEIQNQIGHSKANEGKLIIGAKINEEKRIIGTKKLEEAGTQTFDLLPYEYLLLGILDQKTRMNVQNNVQKDTKSRLSPTTMLDQYVEACTRINNFSGDKTRASTAKKQRKENDGDCEAGEDDTLDIECATQLLQLMQMQLQFERQRREVHAERNRRLLGKLRDSRALEEHNYALTDRLKIMEKEVEGLKAELERNKKEACQIENQYKEAVHHWKIKCVEEQRQNQTLKNRLESVELELKDEQKKVTDCEQRLRSTEASLFDAGHQLRVALKAADRSKELERTLDTVQKKFLLLGEAQLKLKESTDGLSPMTKQEATQIQKSYAEELTNLRRQLESRTSLIEALKVRLSELESKEARKEAQLVELQRLLQETKDQHEAELEAVESKYKAQVEINLLLEGRILELHGTLETATCSTTTINNLASSASPKERSPPLSASLASSSEGSLAFIHSSTGIIMNDCCDTAGEISNLQAIVEPAPSQATSPSRQNQQRRNLKQE
ncbi:tuberous sclerosis 1 protein hamartin [Megachile rotundata]|uniref:tuberous sclerosis 1 protein hamartin n=1 Tax=Megachile rotundata TaxID=143995 RepID=UPI000614EDC5|nr:PREDICTED: hamartin [Megachile rotundata]XP_012138012.1 PREDICTED: hamartin [Megachile rotundata]XP_012138014.1 PREDICTED: hamartin [Megachile rotundata]XP_012138015.1 PREDICTED: hamartin [Megachile rotundata]